MEENNLEHGQKHEQDNDEKQEQKNEHKTELNLERDIKTQFPVARIKRLMQSDDNVGKVAQATPVVVAKALELFMVHIVEASCKQASARQMKRVNMSHLYGAAMEEEKFDFIRETIERFMEAQEKK